MEEEWLEDIYTNAFESDRDAVISKYEAELREKNRQIENLEKIVEEQRKIMKQFNFDLNSFEDNDSKVKHFTGLPSYAALMLVYNFVEKGKLYDFSR